jgi:hypothetical protein
MNARQKTNWLANKRQNKERGRNWSKLYGILLGIHKEIDPEIQKRNAALANVCHELAD